MRSTLAAHRATKGFTLVEMLVVAPIAILLIAAFVGVMISMVGSTLISEEKSNITHSTEQALAQIEQDVRGATEYATTGTVASPQGANNNSTAWTTKVGSGGPLVLSQYATTENPRNTARENSLFYIDNSPNACSDVSRTYSTAYRVYVVYFVKDSTLWRRTILPNVITSTSVNKGQPNTNPSSGNLCDTTNSGASPWQKNSCTNGSGGNCAVKDDRVADHVDSLSLKFYSEPSDTATISSYRNASTVDVTLKLGNSVAGQSFDYTGSIRSYHLN